MHRLGPVATFRAGDAEVGVFVEPSETTPRAFARTRSHAITLRVRQGTPERGAIEALGRWVAAQVEAGEHDGGAFELGDPPAPWIPVTD